VTKNKGPHQSSITLASMYNKELMVSVRMAVVAAFAYNTMPFAGKRGTEGFNAQEGIQPYQ